MYLKNRTAKKLFRAKFAFLLCTIAAMSVYASGYSQTITFSGKDVPLKNMFAIIREQTGYSVFYNKKLLDKARPVTIDAKEMPLINFLNHTFMNQRLKFRIDDKTIILSEKPADKINHAESNSTQEVQQDRIITGKVTDEKGAPLLNATVTVSGTKISTLTKEDGTFSIKVSDGSSLLVISYVGMLDKEITITDRTTVSITMSPVERSMDDVVVIGYGTQKRSQTTGAVASIKASEIQDIPAPNIAGTLRGRIAGLGVSSASGRPGASITLNVRNSAISEQGGAVGATAEPLYVIDNIIVDKATFDNLDPSMVDDITILKDASAAIYGAAGAKGVVLITTKRGKAGAPRLSYNGYVGLSDATKKPQMLSAYEHAVLLNDTYRMNNATPDMFFSQSDLEYLKGLSYKGWFDEIWQPSLTQRHNLSISGGSDRMTFFAGGSYQNENANYAGMKQDKFSFRSGLTAKIAKSLKADIGFNVDHRIRDSKNGTSENDQQFLEKLIQVPRWVPFSLGSKWVNDNGSANSHPMGQIESGFYKISKTNGYRINASLMYQPESGALKGFTARLQVSQGGSGSDGDEYRPNYQVHNFKRFGNNMQLYADSVIGVVDVLKGDNTRLYRNLGNSSSYQGFLTLQYAKTFGRHSINAIAGGEQSASKGEDLGVYWINQQVPGFDDYWAFEQAPNLNGVGITESTKRSFFGRVGYNFDNKYTLEGITRFDASSNFAKGNIWGVFPSVGVGWVVSQENFFRDHISFFNYFKLRANYGLTGDDRINSRLWQERFKVDATGYLYNETLVPGLKPQIIPNPDITWEKKRTINVGVEMSLFKNKLSLGVDAFQNYIYDAFDKGNDQNFPMYAGFKAPVVNYQIRYAWGYEFSIGYQTRFTRDLHFRSNVNFGFSNSVIDRMFYNRFLLWENSPEDWQIAMGTNPRKYNDNNYGLISLGMFRTQDEVDAFLSKNPNYTIDGLVPQPGWLYFKDANGDGVITDRDKAPMFDRVDPTLITGIQFGLTYKSLSMSVNMAAQFGGKEFYDSKARRSNPSLTKNVPVFWTDRWSPENPNGRFPRVDDPSIENGWESTFWAVNATMIRVNDMTISYKLPAHITKKAGIDNARILATGNNLWVIKNPLKYKDPYSSYIYDYPTLRTISVGLSLGL
jgi:TonB-linked SusC/RagA family outer membrane protein